MGQSPTASDYALRGEVYRFIAARGAMPSVAQLAAARGEDAARVRAALRRLHQAHLLVLRTPEAADAELRMAHPFAAVRTGYWVQAGGLRYDANCAWDTLAIPSLLGVDATMHATWADDGAPWEGSVQGGAPTLPSGVVHFAVAPAEFWADIGFT